MKHTLTFLLLLLLNATTLRAYSRFTSDGLTYQTLSETEVAVTGFTRESQSIVIPSEVEHDGILYAVSEIGQWAFSGCSAQVFSLPESLRSIGKSAFTGSGLIAIELPAAVTFLGAEAFSDCRSLTAVTLSSGITEIGERTFSGCTFLTAITLPDRISIIGEEAFLECTALSSLQFPQSLTSIRSRAFKGCQSLASVALSGNVRAIESEAFSGCAQRGMSAILHCPISFPARIFTATPSPMSAAAPCGWRRMGCMPTTGARAPLRPPLQRP